MNFLDTKCYFDYIWAHKLLSLQNCGYYGGKEGCSLQSIWYIRTTTLNRSPKSQ